MVQSKLVSVLGIPVEINATWLIAFVGISFYLSVVIFPDFISTWSIFQYWLAGTITTLLLFNIGVGTRVGALDCGFGSGFESAGNSAADIWWCIQNSRVKHPDLGT